MTRLAACLAALLGVVPMPSVAEIAKDAAIILDAGEGQVRKWSHAPIIAVIYSGDFPRDVLESHLENIRVATGLSPTPFLVRYLDLTGRTDEIFNGSYYRNAKSEDELEGGRGRLVILGQEVKADMFVMSLDARAALFVAALMDFNEGRFLRDLAENRTPSANCFYVSRSRQNRIGLAYAFVKGSGEVDQAECIYEEVIQAFGLLNDSQDTPYFTLDNLAGVVAPNYDFGLLSALYDPLVPAGGHVQDVVEIFMSKVYPPVSP
jgi:hypothetical protein